MTPQGAANQINGNLYGKEVPKELAVAMKSAGLVAVYGASDDNMEFAGAIEDEIGAYEGGTAYLTPAGLLTNDCENHECPHFEKIKATAATVEATWDPGDGLSWRIDTKIPHAKFVTKEDGEPFCEGIVFALADIPAP